MAGPLGGGAGGRPAAAGPGPAADRAAPTRPRRFAAVARLRPDVAWPDDDRPRPEWGRAAGAAGHAALPLRGVPRPRRHGRGVARPRHHAGARGGPEGDAEADVRGGRVWGSVRGRGSPRRPVGAPVDRAGLRRGRTARRAAVLRDETDPRPDAGGIARGPGDAGG